MAANSKRAQTVAEGSGQAQAMGITLINPADMGVELETPCTSLHKSVAEYLAKIKTHKSWKTFLAYSDAAIRFRDHCEAKTLESITVKHLFCNHIEFLLRHVRRAEGSRAC